MIEGRDEVRDQRLYRSEVTLELSLASSCEDTVG